MDNNNENLMTSELNNIGGHISGHMSTAQTSDRHSQQRHSRPMTGAVTGQTAGYQVNEDNDNLFSYVSRDESALGLEDLNHNDFDDDQEVCDDDYPDSGGESGRDRHLDGRPIAREYSDDFDIDEEYEREGEYDEESEDEDESDLLANAGATTVFGLTELDRSLGEVYTIPEEEEDLISPQMSSNSHKTDYKLATVDNDLNSDTAATLHRWRGNH